MRLFGLFGMKSGASQKGTEYLSSKNLISVFY